MILPYSWCALLYCGIKGPKLIARASMSGMWVGEHMMSPIHGTYVRQHWWSPSIEKSVLPSMCIIVQGYTERMLRLMESFIRNLYLDLSTICRCFRLSASVGDYYCIFLECIEKWPIHLL